MNLRADIAETFSHSYFKLLRYRVHTPLEQAVKIINARQRDTKLRSDIHRFLSSDIPPHFNGPEPIFYLSRYIATPDYETLHYIKLVSQYKLPTIIGEDTTDILTSHSTLKRNLIKLPIVTGIDKNGDRILEYKNIADLNSEQGKRLRDVAVHNGLALPTVHRRLARKMFPKSVTVADESAWVDRNSRGKLVQLYESMLALFLVHGIMLEHYEPDEVDFLSEVVLPAMRITKKRFGCTPLIAPLQLQYSKKITDLNSYPVSVKKHIEEILSE